ncbi:MAG TPA: carbohydrate ABC transporter permease [Ilumatobacteraceae bacterium]|jgi:ABC-type glycerol-3-phosphate transport system permease component|nr:carbohydrate ABC transporter permease [Ilumatobacteraceae bacterium]
MSVRRKGPRATAVKVATYVLLGTVAIIVLFPFVVAVSTSLKRNTDIFTYPPSLVPRTERTITDPERDLESATVYVLPGRDGEYALADNDIPIAEFRRIDDPTVVIARPPGDGTETDRTTLVDGDEETIYLLDVDGEQVEVYRARLTVGGLFVPITGDGESVVELVNLATPDRTFGPRFENFSEVVTEKNLGRSLTNTVLVTIAVVVGQIVTSVLGGYAFARIDFKGRDQLFLLYLGSVMIPFVVLIIPLFQLMLQLGWTDNLVALIIPFVFTAYGTFLMRQFFLGIPKEIEEAALIDGASRATILWKVMVPLARPAIATLATFGFLYAWNSFFWPLVIINSGNPDNGLLTLTLATLGGRSSTDTNLVFAGAVLAMTPPILVFLFAQRYFVENSASSGLK